MSDQPDRAALMADGQAAHTAGRLIESEAAFRRLAGMDQQDWQARLYLGIVVAKTGRGKEAAALLTEVLEQSPTCFEALFWLSVLARKAGDAQAALSYARKAAKLQPDSPNALNNLGVAEMEAGNLDAAATAFGQTSSLRPSDPTVLYNLGSCLGLLGREQDALQALRSGVRLAPSSLDIRLLIAKTLLNLNELPSALEEAKAALQLNPSSAAVHRFLALVLMHSSQIDLAMTHIQRALELEPCDASAYAILGLILQSKGDVPEARDAFRKSIELEPSQAQAYSSLVHSRRVTDSDRNLLTRMRRLAGQRKLPPKEISSLEYALGKACEDLGEYAEAMAHYDEANLLARKLKFGEAPYDAAQAAASTDIKIRRYTRAFLDQASAEALKSDRPIFIVGMMRSGTTLVEQILSSHPAVAAGGELDFWTSRALECLDADGRPDLLNLRILARAYLKLLSSIAGEADHVTDKMPANYLYLGLIHAAFPNARFIHTRRSPADTAISIYATPNRARIDFAHDKKSIVLAYREYERLMRHWRTLLPGDRFLEVQYEDLAKEPKTVTKKLAEFCGLDWDDRMLDPQSNGRAVLTPSAWQVRQPVYQTSIDRWRSFEPWLGPFKQLLES